MRTYDVSVNQNRHGVDLTDIEPGDWWRVDIPLPEFGAQECSVVSANLPEDEFEVSVTTGWENRIITVDGDAFYSPVTSVDQPLTDDQFADLTPGDVVCVHVVGNGQAFDCHIEDVDHDANRVLVRGEANIQTIHRWVDRDLIWDLEIYE